MVLVNLNIGRSQGVGGARALIPTPKEYEGILHLISRHNILPLFYKGYIY